MPIAHHTKTKGDLGVAKASADLVAQGFIVLLPTTEHAPFDLVAYDGAFHRVQVKYRSATPRHRRAPGVVLPTLTPHGAATGSG